MKFLEILTIVLAFLLVAAFVGIVKQPSFTGYASASSFCFDLDGDDAFTTSEVVVSVNGVSEKFVDRCYASGLVEYVCSNGRLGEKIYSRCECEDGRCRE
ncbi:hypothetical protein HY571_02935 [Candidatus Micrarchaeota archaeon]|nr:hypothetical protein [Candidatus Micrarchaeota archaeon]